MILALAIAAGPVAFAGAVRAEDPPAKARAIDFNRQIRPILSNQCFHCHGPDANERKGVDRPLRLDTEEGLTEDLGGYAAVKPGDPDESELIRRIASDDELEAMPPPRSGKKLTPEEVELLTEWVRQGAPYARHWSYVKPTRPAVPEVKRAGWVRNPIDAFILARLEREGLAPTEEADRPALIRRLALDLTGLPPTLAEVDAYVADDRPDAHAALVGRLLAKPSFGEHWARLWLDLARYADSAGYADDPPRTIWAYRDYVIRSLNANKPFDQFTLEQVAGDLLPGATEEQLIATAFHRNTMTNNEGGTNDEEFRNVAIVDRVNTTMAVWMGTTMACAQCHDHKYDPISQADYFRFFAFFNNTEDADRTDESPIHAIYTDEQLRQKADWSTEVARLENEVRTPTDETRAGQARWEQTLQADPAWVALRPADAKAASGAGLTVLDDRSVRSETANATDTYTLTAPIDAETPTLAALRLEALTDDALPGKGPGHASGNFVVTRITAAIKPATPARPVGRFLRVELPGKQKYLSLAEVQAFQGDDNVARKGQASQSSTDFDGPAALALDGNTDGDYAAAKSTSHTTLSDDPWWEVDLGEARPIDRVVIWNRTDNGLHTRLADFRVRLLDSARNPVWTRTVAEAPNPSTALALETERAVTFAAAHADFAQPGSEPAAVIDPGKKGGKGWSVGGKTGEPHTLTLLPAEPIALEPGSTLTVAIEQQSKQEKHTLGRFRLGLTADAAVAAVASTPANLLAIARTEPAQRTQAQADELTRHYLTEVSPETKAARDKLAGVRKQLADLKPVTTVPIQRERAETNRRKTLIQLRGNYLAHGDEVTEGTPSSLHPLPESSKPDRLALARWLVSEDNPLTARVIANRCWEQLFGIGLVSTSEEFGAQGDPPSHPELLDWLAVELVESGWDLKHLLGVIANSATYRQNSRVTPELLALDPDNRLLARGPRVRLSAETIRDQALFVAGLLSEKMYGPPVKPPQPSLGLNAAFGGMIDWKTSDGEDRYRRGLYTTWRRSNPYPSMTTFDAPSREVCTVRRSRTNTPLQALVTLNDPVFVESAQALGRRIAAAEGSTRDRIALGFRLCLARQPEPAELDRLVALHESARARLAEQPEEARKLATEPIGPLPEGADAAELAAYAVVGNVLLNLDELLMKR